jgi:hypothetical protein
VVQFCDNLSNLNRSVEERHQIYYKKLVIQFLTYLPEEGVKISDSPNGIISTRITEGSQYALSVISPIVQEADETLLELSLNCVSSWSSYSTISTESLVPTLELVLSTLSILDLIDTSTEVLVALLLDRRLAGMQRVPELIYPIITSDFFFNTTNEAFNNGDIDFLTAYFQLMSKYGETFTEFLVNKLPNTLSYFELMLKCFAYPDNPDLVEITLNFWFQFEDILDELNELNTRKIPQQLLEYGREVLRRLLDLLLQQMKYPPSVEYDTWKKGSKILK